MRFIIPTLIFSLAFLSINNARGQVGNTNSINAAVFDSTSYLQADVAFISNNVYLGRKDTTALPYLIPALSYHSKIGFYVNTTLSFNLRPHPATTLDLFTIDLGYEHNKSEHIYYVAGLERYFYNSNSSNVRSSVNWFGYSLFEYINEYVIPMAAVNLSFGTKTDIAVGIGANHQFEFFDDKFIVQPSVVSYSGTQRYVIESIKRIKKTKKLSTDISSSDNYKMLDVELSVPLNYTAGHFVLEAVPTYAIPLSPAMLTINKKTYDEKISNTFFILIDLAYKLKLKTKR